MAVGNCDEEGEVPKIAEMKVSKQHKYQAIHNLLVHGNISIVLNCENFSSLSRLFQITGRICWYLPGCEISGCKSCLFPSLSSEDTTDAEVKWSHCSKTKELTGLPIQDVLVHGQAW